MVIHVVRNIVSPDSTSHRALLRVPSSVDLAIDPTRFVRSVFIACVVAEVAFLFLDYHVNYARLIDIGQIRRLANIAREDSLASWFGTAQTSFAALTLWLIYLVVRRQDTPRWRSAGWLTLAMFFTYMTIDDGAQIHERIGGVYRSVQERTDPAALAFFPTYTWQLLFLPAFGALGLFTLAFLWFELGFGLSAGYSRRSVVAAIFCLVVAVGLDFIEGLERDHAWNLYAWIADSYDLESFTRQRFNHSPYTTIRHFSRSIEEFLEMLGNTLLWCVFLQHLTVVASDLRVRFRGTPVAVA